MTVLFATVSLREWRLLEALWSKDRGVFSFCTTSTYDNMSWMENLLKKVHFAQLE